ncbi:outer membrane protein [Lichenifustis flavocetrariae]|uniref:Outer membrane beta-barrel protein n=1 Tax=Lichenifustis flavocetrariae TaxID=2949735 RepID=A0AA42CJ29_9HYPH|nr:outer membrane beta-barrel protein [Lichenifustis flavocetrariae]MCW6507546.1 outer membrane beta-barrel protein [Lichenifustis flavocetrariae]
MASNLRPKSHMVASLFPDLGKELRPCRVFDVVSSLARNCGSGLRMKSLKKLGAAAFVSAASFSAALAADLPSRVAPPPLPPLPTIAGWDGIYVGSTYGYGFTNFKTSQASSRSKSESGQTGGALIGYNFQSGHFVYGAEAGIDLNVIRGNVPGQVGLNSSRLDTMDDIRFRGRIGYEFGWFMPFVAGGAVINETYQSTPNPANYFGQDKRTVGWTAGAGVDFKIDPHQIIGFLPQSLFGPVIVRLEYLHDSLPRETFTLGGGGPGVQTFRTESSSNIGRVALIYRFGDNPRRPYADTLGNVNWGGGYGGIFGGYDSLSTKSRLTGFGNTKESADGGFGGIYAGSNFMFFNNRLMLGVDGSTSVADATGTGTLAGTGDRTSIREFVKADLRGRIGYAFGSFLPFAAAGIDFTRNEQRDLVTGSQVGRVPVDNFTFGGGVDYRVSERVSVRAEYLRDESINRSTIRLNGGNVKQDYSSDAFRFGAAYHFE